MNDKVSNITGTPSLKDIKAQAQAEVNKELSAKAVAALKGKYRELDSAKKIVANIERAIADLEASIEDGSFV